MPNQSKSDRSKAILAVIMVLAMIAAAIFFGSKLIGKKPSEQLQVLDETEKPAAVGSQTSPAEKPSPIDYEDSQGIMAQRKAELGLDKSVDMIVRPGETIKIGDTLVSVDEVLDKIRLKTGDIDEQSIGEHARAETVRRQVKLSALLDKLKVQEQETREIEQQLTSPTGSLSPEFEQKIRARQKEMAEQVQTYRRYQDVLGQLADSRNRLEGTTDEQKVALTQEIDTLNQKRMALEDIILASMWTDRDLNAYGIYVVKPQDNIWNIHFQFLKEYFIHNGVTLSPVADEPTHGGESSGVGRLLKFSETMVYIYNIREKKLATDLNLIHPLSKIVVFNLARVFAMLDTIDYRVVSRIRFDGETLWLPAKKN